MTIDFTVTVSTDGSALNNPHGPMGWGWVEHTEKNPTGAPASESGRAYDCGGASNGTNQIGELCAVLQCLRDHRGDYPLIIETDSQYAINCSTTWIHSWKKNGWKNSKKEPVKNAEIIKAIYAELNARSGSVEFVWVKGHAGNTYNEKVDDLARGFAERAGKHLIDGYLPEEGWTVLKNGSYAEGLILPKSSKAEETVPAAQPTLIDQPLFPENNATLTEELITRLNQATERFDLAAQRLQLASEHMDQAVAKLDEAIRRFDDVSWKNNHQDTLF
ncbi:ribonuclease H family protein [Alloscardovia omnicolens]|jgi:ribonuclease H|uniref:ribonuclease H family protein n=1 Tax=Alloscardovia omnicolens TaxID=419015 RepID=UPI00254EE958|nr:RNase H family protein [Alloscardovia omnicolens]MDK6644035.1 ribonuclease HI [Alloscardovia omnicolens]